MDSASAVILAAASFRTLASRSLPPELIGVALPMLVPGAMNRRSEAAEMNAPAEPARAPAGPTQTTVGTRADSIFRMMSSIDVARPPGVSIWMMKTVAPSESASARRRVTNCAVAGSMVPSRTTPRTGASAAAAVAGTSPPTSRARRMSIRAIGAIPGTVTSRAPDAHVPVLTRSPGFIV